MMIRFTPALKLLIVLALAIAAQVGATFGQGNLAPTGTPGPTMKTLDQIEARTAIPGGTSTVTIAADGTYYLTGSITVATGNAITVTANNVTLDLNGFGLTSTLTGSATGSGVNFTGTGALTVRNGHIRGQTTVVGNNPPVFTPARGFTSSRRIQMQSVILRLVPLAQDDRKRGP